jgi:hypothetical protein
MVTVDHSADELERQILNLLARRDLAYRRDQRTVTHHQRHRSECSGGCGAPCDIVRLRGIERAGLLDCEWNAVIYQEAGLIGHVAVAAEGESEVRLHARAHFTIVGEDAALRSLGERGCTAGVGIAHPDDRGIRHRQYRVRIKRRVPVRDADQNDAHLRILVDFL